MTDDEIRTEWDAFIEYPDSDNRYVTTTSALIFARVIAEMAAQQEREACAKLCESLGGASSSWHAEAIRARGEM